MEMYANFISSQIGRQFHLNGEFENEPIEGQKRLKSQKTHFISVMVHMRCNVVMVCACMRMNDIMPDGMCADQQESD